MDLGLVEQGLGDGVEALEQCAGDGIREPRNGIAARRRLRASVRRVERDRLVAEVDRRLGLARGARVPAVAMRLPVGLVELDDQQSVIEGVRLEDVGEPLALCPGR